MPLSEKEGKQLIADVLDYLKEEEWTHSDIDKLEKGGKLTTDEASFLRKKQNAANRTRDRLEEKISKVVVARFPSRFGKPRAQKKKAEPTPEEVIVPAEEKPIIEVPKTVLERISSGIETQADYFRSLAEIAKKQLEASETLKELAVDDKLQHVDVHEIVYPAGGGEVAIPAGETVLDLWTGDVYLGDGTTAMLSDSLSRLGQKYIRSIYIDAKRGFSVQLDGKAKHTVGADDFFARKGIQCRSVLIDVDAATTIKFWSSTNPDASLEESRSTVITGEEAVYYRAYSTVTASTCLPVTLCNISTNKRLRIDSFYVTCPKSCIQVFDVCLSKPGRSEYWRRYRYDMQGYFRLHDVILDAGDTLKAYVCNYAGEDLTIHYEFLGIMDTV